MSKKLTFLACLLFCWSLTPISAQSTLEDVTAILNANCTGACHAGGSPSGNLDLSGGPAAIAALVGQNPTNPTAAGEGLKLIDPGYPERSFLLRKLWDPAWDDYYELPTSWGNLMPTSGSIDKAEIELIRQWVFFGAPDSGTVINPAILDDYYGGMGIPKLDPPAAPPAGEGFQLRFGSLFLEPGEEREFFKKQEVSFADSLEITKIELIFNEQSHHFILYKFNPGEEGFYPEGLRDVQDLESAFEPLQSTSMVAPWQNPDDMVLPPGAAYFWADEEVLDLNYHIRNYSTDSILASDVYLNIYTRPRQPETVEMISQLLPINAMDAMIWGTGEIGEDLIIAPGGAEQEFIDEFFFPFMDGDIDGDGEIDIPLEWYVWFVSSHTHSSGTDFDIYLRQNGDQIFEGFFNFDYTFNQGFYDWEHPPVRIFEDPLKINMGLTGGLIQKAKYINNTTDTLLWGETTGDEMMLMFIQYTTKPLPGSTAIVPLDPAIGGMEIAPNPYVGSTGINVDIASGGEVTLEVFNLLGESVALLQNGQLPAGNHRYNFSAADLGMTAGAYLVELTVDGQKSIKKIIEQ